MLTALVLTFLPIATAMIIYIINLIICWGTFDKYP